jgi:hypothetical protein
LTLFSYIEVCMLYQNNKNSEDYEQQEDETTTLKNKIQENVYYSRQKTSINGEGSPIINKFGLSLVPLTIHLKPKNYSSLLQLHVKLGPETGNNDDGIITHVLKLGEPLTIAYF